jgi:hypothetical protein
MLFKIADGVYTNAMGEQRIEAGSGFESLCQSIPPHTSACDATPLFTIPPVGV